MDLRAYARIIRRFWPIAIAGAVLAVILGVLAVARVQDGQLRWRQSLQYQSTSVLLVSGVRPWWTMATLPPDTPGTVPPGGEVADPTRLSGLASLYAFFVESDAVRRLVGQSDARHVEASSVLADLGGGRRESLPLLQIVATATSPSDAIELARRSTAAFQQFVTDRQVGASVPSASRVKLEVMNAADDATLLAGRSYTRPVALVFGILVLTALVMLAAENLWPSRPRPAEPDEREEREPAPRGGPSPSRAIPEPVMAESAPGTAASNGTRNRAARRRAARSAQSRNRE